MLVELGYHIPRSQWKFDYFEVDRIFRELEKKKTDAFYEFVREMSKIDFFFFSRWVMQRTLADHPFMIARCYDIQEKNKNTQDLWPRGHFKDLPQDLPMLTANRGWTTHGDLKVGDSVFAPNGKPVKVIGLSPKYTGNKCLKLTLQGKREIVCGETHLWRIIKKHRAKRDSQGYRGTFREEEIVEANHLKVGDNIGAMEQPLVFPQKNLPIHPYLLGVWLGDRTSAQPNITCSFKDIEIIDKIKSLGYEIKEREKSDGRTGTFAFGNGIKGKAGSGIFPLFKKLGLYNNKHIPDIYKVASKEQRMELMCGLMDTDGYINTRGDASFSNINEKLIDDVYELASGLALQPRKTIVKTKVNGEPYISFRVEFRGHNDRPVFSLKRKRERLIFPQGHRNTRKIIKIEQVDSVPTSCITVEGGLYLAGKDLIPTHNSTFITCDFTLWELIDNPNNTYAIFSVTGKDAKKHLRGIKAQLEANTLLKTAWPERFYMNPQNESDRHSVLDGVMVKRDQAIAQASVSAHSLIDQMPTGDHWTHHIFDDLINEQVTNSPDLVEKAADAFRNSNNLGRYDEVDGEMVDITVRRVIGTRYLDGDIYGDIMKSSRWTTRMYPAEVDENGNFKRNGVPIFLSRQTLDDKFAEQGEMIYNAQMGQNPIATSRLGFKEEWLTGAYYKVGEEPQGNTYLIIDPARKKKKRNDFTAMIVIRTDANRKYWLLDLIRDKLTTEEKWEKIKMFVEKYNIQTGVGYEGINNTDLEYFDLKKFADRKWINFIELGGVENKDDRIRSLTDLFKHGRFMLPDVLLYRDSEGKTRELIHEFVQEEYRTWPYGRHDDILDVMARVMDKKMEVTFPVTYNRPVEYKDKASDPLDMSHQTELNWMGI